MKEDTTHITRHETYDIIIAYVKRDGQPGWRFLTNHMQVLLCIARDPDVRTRDIAADGRDHRARHAADRGDLAEAGFVKIERVGRRNRYVIDREVDDAPQAQAGHEIGELLDLLRLDDLPDAEAVAGSVRRRYAESQPPYGTGDGSPNRA